MEADECFHAMSHSEGPGGGDKRYLDREMMTQAVDDMLGKWDIQLEDDADASFKKNHFEPTWMKFASDGKV